MENKVDNTIKCCATDCNNNLGKEFWDNQYKSETTNWDLGEVSPPLKNYFDQLRNKDIHILIPGCGNTYEAEYLISLGFSNITLIDISPTLVEKLKLKFKDNPSIKIILGDFFNLEGEYDLIIEQTFFCAISPTLRDKYVNKMHDLLSENGKLVGLLFDRIFDFDGPPFGGTKNEYISLFENKFILKTFDKCYNSFFKRDGTELFIILIKK
jgi:SAM-dependent methyltransferase